MKIKRNGEIVFNFKDLVKTAAASQTLRQNPDDPRATKVFQRGFWFLLGKKCIHHANLSIGECAALVADECAERAQAASLYLESLVEEGQEIWEDRWAELGIDVDWGERLDGLSLEVEVNAELEQRFRELATS